MKKLIIILLLTSGFTCSKNRPRQGSPELTANEQKYINQMSLEDKILYDSCVINNNNYTDVQSYCVIKSIQNQKH